ncbi:MAG: L,D-transpeptidase family protein [Pacificimonas sp.]
MLKTITLASAAMLMTPAAYAQQDMVQTVGGDAGTASLKATVGNSATQAVYEAGGWLSLWTDANSTAFERILQGAGRHGLAPSRFAPESASDVVRSEVALTEAALLYANALASGSSNPNDMFEVYTIPRPAPDLASGLANALKSENLESWFSGLAPQDDEYRALSEAYVENLRKSTEQEGSDIPSGDLIRPGNRDPRLPAIVARLNELGYFSTSSALGSYSDDMVSAVEDMQAEAGIAVDGIIGPSALDVLNNGPRDRARALAVNLERRRWLPRQAVDTRIDVNIASARLDYFKSGTRTDSRRVIVGKPGWATPQLQSPVYRLVANPTWTVPKSIEREDMANKGQAYFDRNNMVRENGYIVQQPGPENALGLVKFDMRNGHAIYLHDTSAKSRFEDSQRHLSHGCVRVDNALEFARMLAEAGGAAQKFKQASESGNETFVDLPSEIPVRMLYHSAYVGEDGEVTYRPDFYGWDEDVAEALGLGRRDRQMVLAQMEDIGP